MLPVLDALADVGERQSTAAVDQDTARRLATAATVDAARARRMLRERHFEPLYRAALLALPGEEAIERRPPLARVDVGVLLAASETLAASAELLAPRSSTPGCLRASPCVPETRHRTSAPRSRSAAITSRSASVPPQASSPTSRNQRTLWILGCIIHGSPAEDVRAFAEWDAARRLRAHTRRHPASMPVQAPRERPPLA